MSIYMQYCYSRVELVRFLTEAALLFSLVVKWLLLPTDGWWPVSSSPSLEDSTAAEARARHRAAAARAVRATLRVSTYGELLGEEEEDEEEDGNDESGAGAATTCAVCLSEVGRQDAVWELGNCRHVFHKGCLDRWLDHDEHLSCPLCRAPLLARRSPPPPPPAEPSWAVERLLYLFGDDLLLPPPS
ncbi:E3 ubiquitin-protein ligase [Canna indica]|uniref:E3 ubiquitin-protein ligase n=1 Tax=Canna indica TaxID=4628 RepID=A0AAQ3JPZ6_9LILI|nr:E3 ubiquitin-protein ligase [Canna indica]